MNRGGFSLLEILIAVALLAISLVAVMSLQGASMLASRRTERLTVATMLARQKLMDVELEFQKGVRKGEFPDERTEEERFPEPHDDYRWKAELKRIELPAPVSSEENQGSVQELIGKQLTEEISKSVRELRLTVFWTEGGEEQSIDVVTHVVKL